MLLRMLVLALLMLVPQAAARAEGGSLEEPHGKVILTVRGKIARTNSPGSAQFDLSMLEKLPQKTITTTTRWTSGVQTFEGVAATALLDSLEASGGQIEAVALDGYTSPPIAVADLRKYGVILALKKNGEYLKVRDKGPIWMIYPVDDFPELQKDLTTQYKLIWHLRTMVVK